MRDAILQSWRFDPWLTAALALLAWTYLRGALVREPSQRRLQFRRGCGAGRTACYLGGLLSIGVALSSPVEAFAPLLLSAHMVQHLLLTMIAAPLLLLGEPFLPLLRGLPATVRRDGLGPFIASPSLRRAGRLLTHPVVTWTTFNLTLAAWHVPALYEAALRDPLWHRVEHLCLLGSAVLFWWPVVQPAPSRAWWPRWAMVPYLLSADVANTVIAAIFAFAPRVIYATYETAAPALGVDALRDQAAAGAIMWVPGSIAYLVPAALITAELLRPRAWRRAAAPGVRRRHEATSIPLPQLRAVPRSPSPPRRRFDLLRLPLVGALLRRRGARLALRAAMLLLALLVVVDGFLGPAEAPMNLAGTLPWTHWRGVAVLLLLIGGNFLCMTCPFVLPRTLAAAWRRRRAAAAIGAAPADRGVPGVVLGTAAGALPAAFAKVASGAGRRWPKALRNKWTAAGLLAAWLIVYEAFDLWASPAATAWVIVAYFVAAFAVDATTRGGSFCKWLCPLGQFHFAQSTVSPLTVAARDPHVCARCETHDCLRGDARHNGCELELFVPRKAGNLDCTFCLDCADACPHDNVGILVQPIGAELRRDAWRSSLGRLSHRSDVAALLLVLAAGAVANAAGMTGPVLDAMAHAASRTGWPRPAVAAAVVSLMIAAPCVLAAAAAALSGLRIRTAFTAIANAAAPLGAAVWLVHFTFHLVTSWRTAGPVFVRAANDAGVIAAEPAWSDACCANAPEWLLPAQLLVLSLGTALSLRTLAARIGDGVREARGGAIRAAAFLHAWLPGALLILLLWTAAAWVLFQPMDMRGTFGLEVAP